MVFRETSRINCRSNQYEAKMDKTCFLNGKYMHATNRENPS